MGRLVRDAPPARTSPELVVHEPPGRVKQLESNIIFLKHQHRETLQQLHEEIERLKNENRGERDYLPSLPYTLVWLCQLEWRASIH